MHLDGRHQMLIDCAKYVGLTPIEVISIASNAPARYKVYEIAKRSGVGTRTVCQPARELKALQYFLIEHCLKELPVHSAATAYKTGSSIKLNAEMHRKSRVILKLDFVNFFGSIKASDWVKFSSDRFPDWNEFNIEFTKRILFWGEGGWEPSCLAIGAPSSPLLSNAFLFEFDQQISKFAHLNSLVYSRYADDITFSSEGFIDKSTVIDKILSVLMRYRWCKLRLNGKKTKLSSKSFARRVTGLVITNDETVSLGRDRKRRISAMVHKASLNELNEDNLSTLMGLIAFAYDVEKPFVERLRLKYGSVLMDALARARRDR